jgi:hypothetical protein
VNRYRLPLVAIAMAALVVAGSAFGGGWYVVSPAGRKIEEEADEATGGGYR